jgi:sugar phosphate isomerase/epimerase
MPQPQLSIQLYTVNSQLVADPEGTLARLAGMGIGQVEAYAFVDRADALAEAFARHGLQARTGHAPLLSDELRRGDAVMPVPSHDEVFTAARTLGLEIVIDPFVAIDRWLDAEEIDATAARLNAAAEKAADHGLRVGYHNHSQEFNASFGGRSAYEVFADQLRDDVALEVDLFWAATARVDVAALLGRLGDRVKALHMKDGVIGDNPFVVGAPALDKTTLDQRPAGQGELPLLDYLAAAPSTEYAVIEFDYVFGDIFEAVQGSVDFLTTHGVKS